MPHLPEAFFPAQSYEEALRRACELCGVQQEYWDIFGTHHVAPPDVQRAILSSMDVPAGSTEELNRFLEERFRRECGSVVPPTTVCDLSSGQFEINVPAAACSGEVEIEYLWEDGSSTHQVRACAELEGFGSVTAGGVRYLRKHLPLPADARLGYHVVRLQIGHAAGEGRLVLCPDRAYKPEMLQRGGKAAGIAISLYGLRSGRNWGCGDFTDLEQFADWVAAETGASFIALNPLHSIPNRQPYNTSPYLPNCSFYRNPLYLDVERIPHLKLSQMAQRLLGSSAVQQTLRRLRDSEYVEYERVWAIKSRFLKLAFRAFLRAGGSEEFAEFVRAEGQALDRYAVYSAVDEVMHKRDRNVWIWPEWPDQYRDPSSAAIAQFAREHRRLVLFYKYIQWQLDRQLAEAHAHAKGRGLSIGLYHDLALATDRCGSDLWAYPDFYVHGCRVGSPPDDFSPQGQDWAFPPPNSVRHHEDGYRLFVDSIRKNCKHGGALRIDHVMRFFRLFWIPDGKPASEGVYVRDFADDLVRILALESVRNEVIVIGEDLGTVEPYIRESLERHGILSYRLLYFEKNKDLSFKTPDQYPRQALVSVSTHDLPTLAGFWAGRDIEARRNAGTVDEAGYRQQLAARVDEKQRMLDVMLRLGLLPEWFPRRVLDVPEFTGEMHYAVVGFLASTPSELLVLNQEDLFKETDQQNLPGTTEQYPNWRHKMKYTIEELRTDLQALDCTRMFRMWLEGSGRAR